MATSIRLSAAAVCLGLFSTVPAHAEAGAMASDDSTRDPIVVSGSNVATVAAAKTPTALVDIPQSVSVLEREQLDDQALTSLNDALRFVPGVVLGQGEGHRDQIIIRGQSSTADFYLDGLRDDSQYYRPLYDIERIEVLKGANALLFGRGGGGGVVNRVTRRADLSRSSANFDLGADSFGAVEVAGGINQPLGDTVAARIDATYLRFDNHRDFYNGRFFGIAPTLTLALSPRTTVRLSASHDDDARLTDRGIPSLGGVPIPGYDGTLFGSPTLNHSSAKIDRVLARLESDLGGSFKLDAAVQYQRARTRYANIVPIGATASTVTLNGYNSDTLRNGVIGQANLVWQGRTGPIAHTVLAGIEASTATTDALRSEAFFVGANGATLASVTIPLARVLALPAAGFGSASRSSRSTADTLSAFVQDQIEFGDHLQVVIGARRDQFRIASLNRLNQFAASRTDGLWSPRAAVIVKPARNVSFYASYAKSFLPQSGDQFTVLDASTATLAPERFESREVGAKWDIKPGLSLTVDAYRLVRANTRAADPVTGNIVLSGSSKTTGFEAQLAGQITPRWQVSMGYANALGRITTTTTAAPAGRRLDKLPRAQATLWSRYDVSKALGLGLGVIHQSSQFASISNAVRLPGFTRVDAAAFWTVSPRLSVQLNVENLFDTRYYPSAHTDFNIASGAPINARVGVKLAL
jgi:catecholate siderophore receptor